MSTQAQAAPTHLGRPTTLLLAREPIAWGPTETVLVPDNWARSRTLVEAWSRQAEHCHAGEGHSQASPNIAA